MRARFPYLRTQCDGIKKKTQGKKALTDISSAILALKDCLCKKIESLKQQKKGLMQKLLTGKIRAKV